MNPSFVLFFHSELGHYMYVDSVYAKRFQEVAKLVSPMTTTSMAGCFSFYYQRDQAIGNFFSVFTKDQLGHYDEIWRPDVYATTDWKLVQVDIKAPHPLEVSEVLLHILFVTLYCAVSRESWWCLGPQHNDISEANKISTSNMSSLLIIKKSSLVSFS